MTLICNGYVALPFCLPARLIIPFRISSLTCVFAWGHQGHASASWLRAFRRDVQAGRAACARHVRHNCCKGSSESNTELLEVLELLCFLLDSQ